MDEKTMVNDILGGVKSELTTYQTIISETEDMGNPATKPETKEERPSLVARLNEKKAVVAAMDQKAPAVAKKKEEVIA